MYLIELQRFKHINSQARPEPKLISDPCKYIDSRSLTVVLQDQMGCLQVVNEDELIDVDPAPGAVIVNIGDLTQATLLNN
ncbi:hypothetical protein CUMW_222200 [Citrus unshiu]|uniref:Isopenicillin N synthase-like Fe(2+) 2OG dioxygenase domain-containing protein n=1 Tax=Citrus unshiu TaxID=55188 RepID=A0A2H5QFL9_CITUN|nr:hypothetical protein CUMW_222200 [Citrus unshiu]